MANGESKTRIALQILVQHGPTLPKIRNLQFESPPWTSVAVAVISLAEFLAYA